MAARVVKRGYALASLAALAGCRLVLGLHERQLDACFDGARSPGEGDVDCGAICEAKCATGATCGKNDDCAGRLCGTTGRCLPRQCGDGVQSAGETDVDCGGPCDVCPPGAKCTKAQDCADGVCPDGYCGLPLTVRVAGNGKGVIQSTPPRIYYDPQLGAWTGRFTPGAVVLTPVPDVPSSSVFAGWANGNLATPDANTSWPNPCGLEACTVDAAVQPEITATFFAGWIASAAFGGPGDDDALGAVAAGGSLHLVGGATGDPGQKKSTVSWQSSDASNKPHATAGAIDALLSRHKGDTLEQTEWLHFGGPGGFAEGAAVALRDNGERIVAGAFGGSLVTAAGTLVATPAKDNGAGIDMFVLRIAPNGTVLKAQRFGGAGVDVANAVALSAKPFAIYLGGAVGGAFSIGNVAVGGPGNDVPAILRLDEDLNVLGAALTTGSASDSGQVQALAIDGEGNLAATGSFYGVVDFGSSIKLTSSKDLDGFVAVLHPDLSAKWARSFGNPGEGRKDGGFSVALVDGDPVVAGRYGGNNAVFGSEVASAIGGEADEDLFVARFDKDNNGAKWLYHWGTPRQDRGESVAFAAKDGVILVAGTVDGAFDAGDTLVEGGDLWFTGLTTTGQLARPLYRLGGPGNAARERGLAIAPSEAGYTFYLAGTFESAAVPAFPSFAPTGQGGRDALLLLVYP